LGKRTKGVFKFGAVVIGLIVAAKVLQGRNLIPTAGGLGTSLQNFISGAKGAESGLETTPPPNGGPILTEDEITPTGSGGTGGAGGTGAGFSIDPGSVFKQAGFKGLLEQFTVGPGKFGIFSSPLNISVKKGLNLQALGVSGIEKSGLSIRGTPIAGTAISLTRPTLIGSFSTPTGGTRIIRGSPALFQRLKSNLGG